MQWRIQSWSQGGFPKVANLSGWWRSLPVRVSPPWYKKTLYCMYYCDTMRWLMFRSNIIYLIFHISIKQTHTYYATLIPNSIINPPFEVNDSWNHLSLPSVVNNYVQHWQCIIINYYRSRYNCRLKNKSWPGGGGLWATKKNLNTPLSMHNIDYTRRCMYVSVRPCRWSMDSGSTRCSG